MVDNVRGWEGLPPFSKEMYQSRYFIPGENYEGWLNRLTNAYCDTDSDVALIKEGIKNYWFHPSTPVTSNAGVPERGLPVSCFVLEAEDSKEGIFSTWEESNWLGAYGGGIGVNWSAIRSTGEPVGKHGGKSSGLIPFLKVADSATLAVSQGNLRRASQAVYLDISHPEIKEFIELRKATGDRDRRCLNLHHAVIIPDSFMRAVHKGDLWDLKSPKTGEVIEQIDAFDLFKDILIQRVETGEPYILFKDTANRSKPEEYQKVGYEIKTSQLCSEIMLNTSAQKSNVCVLSSLNLEYWDEYKDNYKFFKAVHKFMDNVLQSFINEAKYLPGFEKAVKGAVEERALGIGVMGYHSYLQKNNLPVQALATTYITENIFKTIKSMFDKSNIELSKERGASPLGKLAGIGKRNTTVTAIAPTASISTLCNLTSPGIDPRVANIYTQKVNIGSFTIKNKYLEKVLEEYNLNTENVWKQITKDAGSVQNVEGLPREVKDVFKTAYEIDQRAIIDNVSIMQKYIDQGISTNIFVYGDINVEYLFDIHDRAWKKGLKSLYYTRSTAKLRGSSGDGSRKEIELETDTCLSCG